MIIEDAKAYTFDKVLTPNMPVCGWLRVNNLERRLSIYDRSGNVLGSLAVNGKWWGYPGKDLSFEQLKKVVSPHLFLIVQWIISTGKGDEKQIPKDKRYKTHLSQFIDTLDESIEQSEQENFSQLPSLAILMGAPLAVVRVSVKFESTVNTISDDKRLNETVMGYWIEDEVGKLSSPIFYSSKGNSTELNEAPFVKRYSKESADKPQRKSNVHSNRTQLTMLVNPNRKAHHIHNNMPNKVIDILQDQLTSALAAMQYNFISALNLTPIQDNETKDGHKNPIKPLKLPLTEEVDNLLAWVDWDSKRKK